MYCPSCGMAVPLGLNYCNRCGEELKSNGPITKPAGLVYILPLAMLLAGGVTIGGLAIIFTFLLEFIREAIPLHYSIGIAVIGLAILALTVGFLGSQVSRLVNVYLERGDTTQMKQPKLGGQQQQSQPLQLDAPPRPASSVTEHTTHTLDPVYRERKTSS